MEYIGYVVKRVMTRLEHTEFGMGDALFYRCRHYIMHPADLQLLSPVELSLVSLRILCE